MPRKPTKYIYIVKLTEEQRSELLSLVNKGEHNARIIKRANTLLLSDQGKTTDNGMPFSSVTLPHSMATPSPPNSREIVLPSIISVT